MMWFTHVSFGLMVYLSISYVSGLLGIGLFSDLRTLVVALGSLLPDLDHPRSLISTRLSLGGVVGRLTEHRGFTHTFEGALAVCIPVGLLLAKLFDDLVVALTLFIGYLSHLLTDALTVTGIRWSWLKGGPRTYWRIRTGSWLELIVLFPSLVLGSYLFVRLSAPDLVSRDPTLDALTAFLVALILTAAIVRKGAIGRRGVRRQRRRAA